MSLILEKIDDEIIFDQEHIIMNYFRLYNNNPESLKNTNIQISQNIFSSFSNINVNNSQKFASDFFDKLSLSPLALELVSPIISSFPNSDLGLFLTVFLKKNFIELSENLNNSSELFQKYKNWILSIFHSISSQQKHPKILENICASITVLILIGFQGQWTSGIDQLIYAAKQGDINSDNNLIATLILANIENIYNLLEEKLTKKSSKFILSFIDSYSQVINDYINYSLIKINSLDKTNIVNGDVFKGFISILQSTKLFKINIIQIHGLLDYLINCISYIKSNNNDLVVQILEIFDVTFKSKENNLKYDYEKNYQIKNFILYINNITKNENFLEIMNCIKLIQNMTKFYDSKKLNEILNNEKDIQILFAAGNIFNSILENFGYIFFIQDIDDIIQEIFNYFINLKIYKITRNFFSTLFDLCSFSQSVNYKFENYPEEIRKDKKEKFLNFLYSIQNTFLQNMSLSSDEINLFNIDNDIIIKELMSNSHQLDKYINVLLKKHINNDDKIEFIENCDELYNDIYDIISSLFNGKDYCDKLCQYLMSSIENKNFPIIDCIMNIFNFLSFKISREYPDIIFQLIEFIFNKKDILFQNQRFIFQFIKLLLKNYIHISSNQQIVKLILDNLITFGSKSEKLNYVIILLIHKLILSSYQVYKLNHTTDGDNLCQNINQEKDILYNIFNIISNYLMEELLKLDHTFLYKLIDAFYNSLFYIVSLNINNISLITSVSEKLINEANQILYLNNNDDENILKYLFIIMSIIKNIGKENRDTLFSLLNKIELNNDNKQETYFMNIQNNILRIIDLNHKNNNFNKKVIDGIIILNNSFITFFKEKAIEHFDYYNRIISLIISINQSFPKIYSLTLNLYNQILSYNINTDKYFDICKIGFDVLNSINLIYVNKNEEETIYLANKQIEFITLYIQKSSYFINNINNNEIFNNTFNNILIIFDKSNHKDFSINFINLIKILIDISDNNNIFQNILKEKFIEKILRIIIDHIKYFNESYKNCIKNCFYIFSHCINSQFGEKLALVINDSFNEKQITEIVTEYLKLSKINNSLINNDKKIKEFINDLNGLFNGSNRIKYEFIEKYSSEINNYKSGNISDNPQKIKVNPNSQIYMNLFSK